MRDSVGKQNLNREIKIGAAAVLIFLALYYNNLSRKILSQAQLVFWKYY
jgi:hypothetical protein